MEKNKNILIGGLLAIVLVMAVGYAAFATQLNIGGTASIATSWNVHFDNTKTTGSGIIDATTGLTGATAPTGAIAYSTDQLTATLTTKLNQPGDKVVYTLTINNDSEGLSAKAATPVLTLEGGSVDGLVATKGHIKFTVTAPATTTLTAGANTTMTVTAEYIDTASTGTVTAEKEDATLGVTISYTQA